MNTASYVIEQYKKGERLFVGLDMENECFDDQNLEGAIFKNCFFYSSFRGAKLKGAQFIDSNLKTCDFREADLTNVHFENVTIESAAFARAKTNGVYFDNNWAYGKKLTQADFDSWVKDSN